MAEWLGSGLQNRVQQFDSAWYLKEGDSIELPSFFWTDARQSLKTVTSDKHSRQLFQTITSNKHSKQALQTSTPDKHSKQALQTSTPDGRTRKALQTDNSGRYSGQVFLAGVDLWTQKVLYLKWRSLKSAFQGPLLSLLGCFAEKNTVEVPKTVKTVTSTIRLLRSILAIHSCNHVLHSVIAFRYCIPLLYSVVVFRCCIPLLHSVVVITSSLK